MSFILLLMSLYAFDLVTQSSSDIATTAVYRDVASRVASAVLEMTEIGRERTESVTETSTTDLVVSKLLSIPAEVRGNQYTVALAEKDITVASVDGRIVETAGTLNFATPAPADCDSADIACKLTGTVFSGTGKILIKYEFHSALVATSTCDSTPVRNCISIS